MLQMYLRYPVNIALGQLNLLDSHDVPRFLSLCQGDISRYQLALVFLLMYPGVPSIFYGDEKAIQGITESEYRSPMPWNKIEDIEVLMRELIYIRKKYLKPSDTFCFRDIVDSDEVICLERITDTGRVLVWLNGSKESIGISDSISNCITEESVLLTNGFEQGELNTNSYVILFIPII